MKTYLPLLCALALAPGSALADTGKKPAGSRPNIVFMMADDMGWTQPGFDDSSWANASVHSESAVRPKDGYDQISWNTNAKLIWGPDLQKDNIVLCRATVSP